MANTLKDLVAKITDAEKTANIELEALDPRSRPGMACAKRQAQDDLVELKRQYLKQVNECSVGIVCLGENAEALAKIFAAESSTPVVSLNVRDLYRRLAKYSEESLSPNREWNVTQQRRLIDSMAEIGRDYDAVSILPPQFEESGVIPTFEHTVDHVRKLVRKAVGDDLAALYIRSEVASRALSLKYSSLVIPVVVTGLDKEEALALTPVFGKMAEIIDTPETVDAEFARSIFMKIKKQIFSHKS